MTILQNFQRCSNGEKKIASTKKKDVFSGFTVAKKVSQRCSTEAKTEFSNGKKGKFFPQWFYSE